VLRPKVKPSFEEIHFVFWLLAPVACQITGMQGEPDGVVHVSQKSLVVRFFGKMEGLVKGVNSFVEVFFAAKHGFVC